MVVVVVVVRMMLIMMMLLNDDRRFCVYSAHDRDPPVHVSLVGRAFVPRRPYETSKICVQRFPTQKRNFCLAARVPAENQSNGNGKQVGKHWHTKSGFCPAQAT